MPLRLNSFPDVNDVSRKLSAMGLKGTDIAALDIEGELEAIESELAELCGGEFLVEPDTTPKTMRHMAPDGVTLVLRAPFVSSPDAPLVEVALARVDEPVLELLEGVDYTLWPEGAQEKGVPYTGIVFSHTIRCSWNGVLVTGVVGFATSITKARYNAITDGVIWRLYPTISARLKANGSAQNGGIKAKEIGQLREEYIVLDAAKVAALQTEAPLMGDRYDDFVATLCKRPLTA